ncbi:hypothetical protein BaRGS_00038083, partial [Batillaria attramentaria]
MAHISNRQCDNLRLRPISIVIHKTCTAKRPRGFRGGDIRCDHKVITAGKDDCRPPNPVCSDDLRTAAATDVDSHVTANTNRATVSNDLSRALSLARAARAAPGVHRRAPAQP